MSRPRILDDAQTMTITCDKTTRRIIDGEKERRAAELDAIRKQILGIKSTIRKSGAADGLARSLRALEKEAHDLRLKHHPNASAIVREAVQRVYG